MNVRLGSVLDVLTIAVLAFIGFRLVQGARLGLTGRRERVGQIVGGIRLRHVLPVPLVLTGVVTAAVVLLQVPGLDFGWWTAIGGEGNPVTGGSERTVGTVLEWVVPLVFGLLLLPGLPLFAEAEERTFRLGAESWSWRRRLARAVFGFGLVHVVIGVPIGVALALSLGGAWFLYVYLRTVPRHGRATALLESTRAHTAYNGVIVVLLLLSAVLTAFA